MIISQPLQVRLLLGCSGPPPWPPEGVLRHPKPVCPLCQLQLAVGLNGLTDIKMR